MQTLHLSPLSRDILVHLQGKHAGNVESSFQIDIADLQKITTSYSGGLLGYLEQRKLEWIQINIVCKALSTITQKDTHCKLAPMTGDLHNGIDAWLTVGKIHRVGVDLTSVNNISHKIRKYAAYLEWQKGLHNRGRGTSGEVEKKVGRVLIGMPANLTHVVQEIASKAENTEDVKRLVGKSFPQYSPKCSDIELLGLNTLGKKWVQKIQEQ